jgi:RNA polymerase sigma factor (sigma-70 family)
MVKAQVDCAVRQLCRLIAEGGRQDLTDAQLLQRFVAHHEEAAFAALVERHGRMVWGVCRHLLRHEQDAEDVFQATFLLLARKAASIRKGQSLGSWLHGVAYRAALRARRDVARRREHERKAATMPRVKAQPELDWREVQALLDEEVQRLPEKYRAPFVLCCLEGETLATAARRLGWKEGTVSGRLAQARKQLQRRLTRRGIALSAALCAGALARAAAAVPPALVGTTIKGALRVAAGQSLAGGWVSANVATLVEGVSKTMLRTRLEIATALLMAVSLAVGGVGMLTHRALAEKPGTVTEGLAAPPAPPAAEEPPRQPQRAGPAKEARQGKTAAGAVPRTDEEPMTVAGRVLAADGKPLAGASVAVLRWANEAITPEPLGTAKADDKGRFAIKVTRPSPASLVGSMEFVALAGLANFGVGWCALDAAAKQHDVEVRLAAEQPIRGRLVDLEGKNAAGVQVHVVRVGKNLPGKPLIYLPVGGKDPAAWPGPVTTDDEGHFTLRGLGADLATVRVKVKDDRYCRLTSDFRPREKAQAELRLLLEPARVLEGVVTRADTGKPIARARVFAGPPVNASRTGDYFFGEPFEDSEGITDEEGRYRILLPAQRTFWVTAAGPASDPCLTAITGVIWPSGKTKHQTDLSLDPGVLVRGTVTEETSGRPVAGARILYKPLKQDSGQSVDVDHARNVRPPEFVVSGADGSFVTAVPEGSGHFILTGPTRDYIYAAVPRSRFTADDGFGGAFYSPERHYVQGYVPLLNLAAKDRPQEVKATLRRGVAVTGTVIDTDGKPAGDVWMTSRLLLPPPPIPYLQPMPYIPQPVRIVDGRFELHGCDPKETYQVFFLDPRNKLGAYSEISVKKAAEMPVSVRLAPCGQAVLRVVDYLDRPPDGFRGRVCLVVTPGLSPSVDFFEGQAAKQGRGWAHEVDLFRLAAGVPNFGRDDQKRFTYRYLIPGATYRLDYQLGQKFLHKDFTVKSGELLRLPDIILPEEGGRP